MSNSGTKKISGYHVTVNLLGGCRVSSDIKKEMGDSQYVKFKVSSSGEVSLSVASGADDEGSKRLCGHANRTFSISYDDKVKLIKGKNRTARVDLIKKSDGLYVGSVKHENKKAKKDTNGSDGLVSIF